VQAHIGFCLVFSCQHTLKRAIGFGQFRQELGQGRAGRKLSFPVRLGMGQFVIALGDGVGQGTGRLKLRIAEFQPPIGAENRNRLIQRV